MKLVARSLVLFVGMALFSLTGCSNKPPALHPIKGKVTLGGKGYERLIVYFRPESGTVNEYNLGVGETDKDGNLTLRSTAGAGLAAGKYKVTFTHKTAKTAKKTVSVGIDDKPDDSGSVEYIEHVPEPYDDDKSQESTPVRFEVKPGENNFTFDIPTKK